mgnify:CR=1 FL=1
MENQQNLVLNEQAVDALRTSAKWSMFLAIMGFVGIAFMIIAALIMTSVMSAIPTSSMSPLGNLKGYLSGFYLFMALLYFPPVYYLFKYATDMKNALLTSSSNMVSVALGYLKSHHKYLGISIIVVLSLYLLFIIGIIVFVANKGMNTV